MIHRFFGGSKDGCEEDIYPSRLRPGEHWFVPFGETLYLFHLKDEGIMFYYSRLRSPDAPPVKRLKKPDELPSSGEPVYCILDEPEWRELQTKRHTEALLHLEDEQRAPIVLVRCH